MAAITFSFSSPEARQQYQAFVEELLDKTSNLDETLWGKLCDQAAEMKVAVIDRNNILLEQLHHRGGHGFLCDVNENDIPFLVCRSCHARQPGVNWFCNECNKPVSETPATCMEKVIDDDELWAELNVPPYFTGYMTKYLRLMPNGKHRLKALRIMKPDRDKNVLREMEKMSHYNRMSIEDYLRISPKGKIARQANSYLKKSIKEEKWVEIANKKEKINRNIRYINLLFEITTISIIIIINLIYFNIYDFDPSSMAETNVKGYQVFFSSIFIIGLTFYFLYMFFYYLFSEYQFKDYAIVSTSDLSHEYLNINFSNYLIFIIYCLICNMLFLFSLSVYFTNIERYLLG